MYLLSGLNYVDLRHSIFFSGLSTLEKGGFPLAVNEIPPRAD